MIVSRVGPRTRGAPDNELGTAGPSSPALGVLRNTKASRVPCLRSCVHPCAEEPAGGLGTGTPGKDPWACTLGRVLG